MYHRPTAKLEYTEPMSVLSMTPPSRRPNVVVLFVVWLLLYSARIMVRVWWVTDTQRPTATPRRHTETKQTTTRTPTLIHTHTRQPFLFVSHLCARQRARVRQCCVLGRLGRWRHHPYSWATHRPCCYCPSSDCRYTPHGIHLESIGIIVFHPPLFYSPITGCCPPQ